MVTQYRQRAQARVRERYDWEHVVDEYERLFAHMAGVEPPAPAFVAADPQPARAQGGGERDGDGGLPHTARDSGDDEPSDHQ